MLDLENVFFNVAHEILGSVFVYFTHLEWRLNFFC
jgi:hypothetical protein